MTQPTCNAVALVSIPPAVLAGGRFCLVARGQRLVPLNLMESMAAGCVPVFMADNLVLPFDEIIDWTLASVRIRESGLHSLVARLQAISAERTAEMRQQVQWLYARYFGSLERVVQTLLDQLNDRIFPHVARDQRAWNHPRTALATRNPLFLAMTAARAPGFTAVILTYDRVESLFTLIEKLSIVPSLHKILVVWNNQKKAPPHCECGVDCGPSLSFTLLTLFVRHSVPVPEDRQAAAADPHHRQQAVESLLPVRGHRNGGHSDD